MVQTGSAKGSAIGLAAVKAARVTTMTAIENFMVAESGLLLVKIFRSYIKWMCSRLISRMTAEVGRAL